ncbi:hypothetical protein SAMN05216376_111142 [Mameliella alba]|uniref:hypothetical protein n=1 Tax=Mameliella alba TaxID=561184 RepID=UPI00088A2A82|nr:hypothetical protein [Mameliella alba]OWV46473.1 hypothetical protein CDZ96_17830 [Mameliella alba]PTR37282.1 hypothetical protein LX94_03621 [Mameliella alba]GGF73529.1 hypothetical protein GCM10011319_37530 [Mameliella alba]SDD76982.1 hypothetical protein SAMN05216376_111142 [Mameliella alba]
MTEHSARGVTATELVAELEQEFRTGAAIAECHGPGTRFVVSLGVDLLPAQGREVAALLARARTAKAEAEAQAGAQLWGELDNKLLEKAKAARAEAAQILRRATWHIGLSVSLSAVGLVMSLVVLWAAAHV